MMQGGAVVPPSDSLDPEKICLGLVRLRLLLEP